MHAPGSRLLVGHVDVDVRVLFEQDRGVVHARRVDVGEAGETRVADRDVVDVAGEVEVVDRQAVERDVRCAVEVHAHRGRRAVLRADRHHRGLHSPGEGPVVARGQTDRARLRGGEFAAQSGGAVGRAITAARRRRRGRRRDRRDDDRLHRGRRAAESVLDAEADPLRARCGERERQHLAGAQRPLRTSGAINTIIFPRKRAP